MENSDHNMMNLDSSESVDYPKPKISNLTRNLQSGQFSGFQPQNPNNSDSSEQSSQSHIIAQSAPNNPPSYYSSVRGNSLNPPILQPHSNSSQGFPPSSSFQPNSFQNLNSFSYQNSYNQSYPESYSKRDSINYIPSSHNTPNMVSSSYSSNSSYKYAFKPSHSIPTTNVTTDNNFIPNFQRHSASFQHPQPQQGSNSQTQRPHPSHQHSFTTSDNLLTNITPTPPQALNYVTEPDHYMSYNEFFQNLSLEGDEEHINIVDYPVNDLILMLSCLLTKIIEANDKLHPNHFDNTIAIHQKMKEERKQKKLAKQQRQQENEEPHKTHNSYDIHINESVIDHDSSDDDDDDDEMKNRYLANVLAFHGTNIPGISLHAYLSRVLKYCPVTNEVFLSLLVYFDRIAKKANNLKKGDDSDNEQLFVMDSYNIHRLIISGITVLSKFFSDIFYKNLRYAKVGGLPLEELNYLELQLLLLLDFKLMISVEDLQNYGDLLLRFWKREQITQELVNNPSSGIKDNQEVSNQKQNQGQNENQNELQQLQVQQT